MQLMSASRDFTQPCYPDWTLCVVPLLHPFFIQFIWTCSSSIFTDGGDERALEAISAIHIQWHFTIKSSLECIDKQRGEEEEKEKNHTHWSSPMSSVKACGERQQKRRLKITHWFSNLITFNTVLLVVLVMLLSTFFFFDYYLTHYYTHHSLWILLL